MLTSVRLPETEFPYVYLFLTGLITICYYCYASRQYHKRDNIPTLGTEIPVLSLWGAIRYVMNSLNVIQEGYVKYKGRPFKIAQFDRWLVVLTTPHHIEELRKAPEEGLSSRDAVESLLKAKYTLGMDVDTVQRYLDLFREKLANKLGGLTSEVHEEMQLTLNESLPRSEDWQEFCVLPSILKILFRTTNRAFVGAPLCRSEEYVALGEEYTTNVFKGAVIYNALPKALLPLLSKVLDFIGPTSRRCEQLFRPEMDKRVAYLEEHDTDASGKYDDLLTWLIATHGTRDEINYSELTRIVLIANLAAVHSTAMVFTFAIFHAAADPEVADALRAEVSSVVAEHGWTATALTKMQRLDSFVREVQRVHTLGAALVMKIARTDYAFADGSVVPRGSLVTAPATTVHRDEEHYPDAHMFKPWRFVGTPDESEADAARRKATSTSPTFLAWGHGKHSCPGRFFAVRELKMLLGSVLLRYDVRLKTPGVLPQDQWYLTFRVPDPTACVLLKRRTAAL